MERYKTIQEDIEQVTNNDVTKQMRVSGMALGLIAVAIVCAILGKTFEDPNSSMPTFLFTAAALLLLGGIIKFFVGRNGYVFKPTKSPLKPAIAYFDIHESDALQNCVEMKRFDDLGRLKREKDTGVKLEAMITGDGKFAAVQILEYIPYTYEAVTPVKCYYNEEAQKIASFFKN